MRQAILISRRTGRPTYWVQWRSWWLRVNRLARSPEELESLGRRLARADVDAPGELKGMLFFNRAMLDKKGVLVVLCSQCGAAPAEREGRCVWCQRAAGGKAGGGTQGGSDASPAAAVALSGAQALGWCQDLPIYQGVGTA